MYDRACVLKCKPTYSADEAAPKDDGLPVKQIPQLRIPARHAGVPPRMLLRCCSKPAVTLIHVRLEQSSS